jgi:integrase
MKAELTDISIKKLKPEAKPYEVMDSKLVPGLDTRGLGIRVMGKPGAVVKSFILFRRFPGSENPVRRTLGRYPALTLAEARQKADEWNTLLKKKLDPKAEEAREEQQRLAAEQAKQEAERQQKENTFGNAFESYLRDKASKQRSGAEIERVMRQEFASWMDRPLTDISQENVKAITKAIKNQGLVTKAHVTFAMLRTFFNWAVDTGDFGVKSSPCIGIKPKILIGERNVRDRVLRDFEIASYWRASKALGYPFGKFFQLLALTALRRDEAANAEWSEIEDGLWVIPPGRMKNGAAHAIPLTTDILALLDSLPRFVGGDFIFSTMSGRRPISGFSKAKARLDTLMSMDLETQGKPFEPFVLHDVRRTCRTRFSALPVEETVRELLMAHARPGLHKVYDLHAYEQEKAHALTLWHAKLKAIVEPKPDNVVPLYRGAHDV